MIMAPATVDDLESLLGLESTGFDAPERWSRDSWAAELDADQRLVVVSREVGRVGAVACFSVLDETAELLRVVVAPDCRGRGTARRLVGAGKDWAQARGARRMLLEVRPDNEPALAVYRATGFQPIARRKDYYGTGRHAVVMECEI